MEERKEKPAKFGSVRYTALMPNNEPRYIRAYDNGGATADRYTVYYTGRRGGSYVTMSERPTHPQGVCQHGSLGVGDRGDRNEHGFAPAMGRKHPTLGKHIEFSALPEECQWVVLRDYAELWNLQVDVKGLVPEKRRPIEHEVTDQQLQEFKETGRSGVRLPDLATAPRDEVVVLERRDGEVQETEAYAGLFEWPKASERAHRDVARALCSAIKEFMVGSRAVEVSARIREMQIETGDAVGLVLDYHDIRSTLRYLSETEPGHTFDWKAIADSVAQRLANGGNTLVSRPEYRLRDKVLDFWAHSESLLGEGPWSVEALQAQGDAIVKRPIRKYGNAHFHDEFAAILARNTEQAFADGQYQHWKMQRDESAESKGRLARCALQGNIGAWMLQQADAGIEMYLDYSLVRPLALHHMNQDRFVRWGSEWTDYLDIVIDYIRAADPNYGDLSQVMALLNGTDPLGEMLEVMKDESKRQEMREAWLKLKARSLGYDGTDDGDLRIYHYTTADGNYSLALIDTYQSNHDGTKARVAYILIGPKDVYEKRTPLTEGQATADVLVCDLIFEGRDLFAAPGSDPVGPSSAASSILLLSHTPETEAEFEALKPRQREFLMNETEALSMWAYELENPPDPGQPGEDEEEYESEPDPYHDHDEN